MLDDLTGKRFGRLTVISRDKDHISASGRHHVMWMCKCDCGNNTSVYSDFLKREKTKSCGCLRRELSSKNHKTHGSTNSNLYGVWCAMKTRCTNPNTEAFKNYGGRGVTVCDEWFLDFQNFKDWAYKNGYDENLTIDRIDVNGNYEPSNCRWVTGVAQANNRRSNHAITFNGETHNVTEWATILNINPKTLFNRLYTGWSIEKALNI